MSQKIQVENGVLKTPNNPVIPFIEGDGTGPDIWAAAKRVLDAAVKKAYNGEKEIAWKEVLAGEKAFKQTGEWLPQATLDTIDEYLIAIKGPLTTPIGGRHSFTKRCPAPRVRFICLFTSSSLFQRCSFTGETSRRHRYGHFP